MSTAADAMPRFIEPARAATSRAPPSDPAWVHEIKMDGYRVQARIENGAVMLSTRNGHDWTDRLLGLVPAFARLPVREAIIDGEIIVEDARGVSDFSLLQAALKSPRSKRLAYVAFDLLHLDGESLLACPLAKRKARLEAILTTADGVALASLRYCQHLTGDGRLILVEAAKLGVEGLVSKRLDAPYRPGRDDWRKVKLTLSDEFVVCGYVEAASPKANVGALVLGYFENDRLVYAGRVGTGFTRHVAAGLWRHLEAARTARPTLEAAIEDGGAVRDRHDIRWVPPTRVVQVEYSGWTSDGLLRHARYKGMREDKAAIDVRRPGTA